MEFSTHYNLNLVEGTDIVNPLVQDRPNYVKLDQVAYSNECESVGEATELKTGTVHAITRTKPNQTMFRFTATSNFEAGDTFTVDTTPVTALLPNGKSLPNACFVVNGTVLCSLVGTLLTVYSVTDKAEDSDKLGGHLPAYFATDSDLNEAVANINNIIDLSTRNILFVMDSYGNRVTTDNKDVATAVHDLTGASCVLVHEDSAGLPRYTTLVKEYSGNHDIIDTIFLIGGANDQGTNYATLVANMSTFINTCKTYYPNLKRIYVFCCGIVFSTTADHGSLSLESRDVLWNGYKDGAVKNGATYVDNSQYVLRNTTLLASDRVHPNASGMDEIVKQAICSLINNRIDVHYRITTNFDQNNTNYIMTRDNAIVTLTNIGGNGYMLMTNNAIDATGATLITYGTFTDSLIDNATNDGANNFGGLAYYSDGSVRYPALSDVSISDNVAKGYLVRNTSTDPTTGIGGYLAVKNITINN